MSDISKLRGLLPIRYSKLIRERLIERTGKVYSISTIKMVIQGKRTNDFILEEAILLANEERDRRLRIAEKLESIA